jgi:hypothetical protein
VSIGHLWIGSVVSVVWLGFRLYTWRKGRR